jgi:hypothetical protein
MFQRCAGADSKRRSSGLRGNFQYLAECADGVSRYFDGLVPACVRHHDDPQRGSPTDIAVGRKYAEDALGNCLCLISCRYDDANSLDGRMHAKFLAIRRVARRSQILHRYSRCGQMIVDHDLELQDARQLTVKIERRGAKLPTPLTICDGPVQANGALML